MARIIYLITFFYFCLFLYWPQYSYSQANKFVFEHITSEERSGGLDYLNSIRVVYQDHYGYIWIGLNTGLVRFDGYEFKIFEPDRNDTSSFQGRMVTTFTEDVNGDIWIGTKQTGVFHFIRDTEKFVQYVHNLDDSSTLSHNEILYLLPDSLGYIWCVSDSKNGYLDRIDPGNRSIKRLTKKHESENKKFLTTNVHFDPKIKSVAIVEGNAGSIWFGLKEGQGLCKYKQSLDSYTFYWYDEGNQNGLRSDSVYSLAKDHNNNIWIGTSKGLHKYNEESDGFIYFPEISCSENEGHKDIFNIYLDSRGMLFLTMYSKVFQFNPVDNSIKTASILPRDQRNYFNIIGEVPGKGIWIDQSNFTFNFYDYVQERVTAAQSILLNRSIYEWGKPFKPISSYLIDNSGLLWIAMNQKGLYKENEFIRSFDDYNPPIFEFSEGMTNNPTNYICEDQQGIIWFTTRNGLYFYNNNRNTFYSVNPEIPLNFQPLNQSLFQIVCDEGGELWINTMGYGVYTLDSKSFNAESSINIAENKTVFSSSIQGPGYESVNAVDGDFSTRWGSTFSDPQWLYIDLLEKVDIDRVVIYWEYATGKKYQIQVSDDKNNWETIATIDGRTQQGRMDYIHLEGSGRYLRIFGLERSTIFGYSIFEIEVYRKSPAYNHFNYSNNVAHGLPSDTIYCIFKDSKQNIWLTSSKGLTRFDKTHRNFVNYSIADKGYNEIIKIHEDRLGNLWLMSNNNTGYILNFNPHAELFHSFQFPDTILFDSREILQKVEFYEDTDGRFWAIGKQVDQGQFFIYLYHQSEQSFELKYSSHFDITGIIHEKGNLFWVSLTARGLHLVDMDKGQEIKAYDNTNGLSNLEIKSIKKYSSKYIWIQYNSGICRFDPVSETFNNYNRKYGIQDIITLETFQSSSGYVYVPGMNGFNVFHPDSLRFTPNTIPPNLAITTLKVNGREIGVQDDNSILSKHISKTDVVNLSSLQNTFTIGFTGFHYGLPEENNYATILEGLDDEWNYIGTKREVTYSGLSSGNYVFKVKAANADGVWNESYASLTVIIHSPWYISWWAISIFILGICGLVYTSHRWRTRIHRKHIDKKQKEIDEHKELNERLKQVDELKDQFLANTSHELRTPLVGIIGLAESLKDGIAGKQSAKAIDILNMVTASGKRLSNLINDILDFSKLKNNELKLQLNRVDVHTAVDIVITILHPLLINKEVRLINDITDDSSLVLADENRLQQILINLIGNAIKFTDEGSIVISSETKDDFLSITVSDTGIGIPEDKKALIFRSFEQVDMDISKEYEGTGIGLSITNKLINLHGGTIEVDSEVGKGSKFTFTIPISKGKLRDLTELDRETKRIQLENLREIINRTVSISEETVIEAGEKIQHSHGEQMNILIVDDEPVNLQVLDNYLSIAGYNITQAKNGIIALELLNEGKKYDLVILDVMMPKMSGYEVCNKLREMFQPNELPVIMLTVKNTTADLVSGLNCGANDYLTKPFSKDELLSRVKTHLHLHRINRVANRFVPSKFLQSIGKSSIMDVKLGDYANLNVTVFFSDIRKYTSISESMSPEENFRFIHAYVSRMGPIIHQNAGFINQYMGDAIMAIFPEQTHHALDSSIFMQKKITEYNKERTKKGRIPINVGMGLHCGSLTMGIIGDENRSDPSTIADTVNIASRIEQLTKYYGAHILLSENSFNNLPEAHRYHIRYIGNVQVKGKKNSLKVYECFDGDNDKMIKLKMETLTDFDIGLKHFYNKDFPEAAVMFKKILKKNKNDRVASNFYNHSVKHSHKGVPDDWTGIERVGTDQ